MSPAAKNISNRHITPTEHILTASIDATTVPAQKTPLRSPQTPNHPLFPPHTQLSFSRAFRGGKVSTSGSKHANANESDWEPVSQTYLVVQPTKATVRENYARVVWNPEARSPNASVRSTSRWCVGAIQHPSTILIDAIVDVGTEEGAARSEALCNGVHRMVSWTHSMRSVSSEAQGPVRQHARNTHVSMVFTEWCPRHLHPHKVRCTSRLLGESSGPGVQLLAPASKRHVSRDDRHRLT